MSRHFTQAKISIPVTPARSSSVSLASAIKKHNDSKMSFTENGAITHSTTNSKVLDFFSIAGASRAKPEQATKAFVEAFNENSRLACQCLLWLRDIRSGAGERNITRMILQELEKTKNGNVYLDKIIPYLPEMGRWDDLFYFVLPENKKKAYSALRTALFSGNGLAAKWTPVQGPLAHEIRCFMSMGKSQFRKFVVGIRNTVEQQMCAQKWTEINYSHVPSTASARYQKAFNRHDPQGYSKYREELQKPVSQRSPNVKINAGAVYPYDVLKSSFSGDRNVSQAQWDALPDFLGDNKANILPMIDTSGSMDVMVAANKAVDIATSLGIYVAEKNKGNMKDICFTFENKPKAIKLSGGLYNKYRQMLDKRRAENTNLIACFELLLDIAKDNNIHESEMPEYILIISDMEFDSATARYDQRYRKLNPTNFEEIDRLYRASGYKRPNIIFWNVNARNDNNKPVKMKEDGTALVSGFSPSLLKTVLKCDFKNYTPWNVMLQTIDIPRYQIFSND